MGNSDENFRPPFHVNVNGRMNQYESFHYNLPNYHKKNIKNNSKEENTPFRSKNNKKITKTLTPVVPKFHKKFRESLDFDEENYKIKYKEGKSLDKIIKKKKYAQKNKKFKNNSNDDEENMSIDIDVINKNKVNVKIPLNNGKIWQKGYDKNDVIGTVINDYITENKLDLPEDYFSNLRHFNKLVNLHDKISTLLPKELNENDNLIKKENKTLKNGLLNNRNNELKKEINNLKNKANNIVEENKSIDLSHLNDQYTEIMGKPFYNPFEIRCFYKTQRKFKVLNYHKKNIEKFGLNEFDSTSAYCNGLNHLYISGGEHCINKLWDINLKKNLIHDPVDIPPKKYHSIIFIPKFIVFFVGGNNSDTFYYNLKLQKVVKWGKLNIIRIEPALQIIDTKLYCIDSKNSLGNKNNYTIEVTDLTIDEGEWILIKPKLQDNINTFFNQQYFGVCKDKDDNILFLGGKFSNVGQNNMNFKYNVINNNIEVSQVKFKEFNLKEKTFCPFNKLYDYILTDFQKESPQIAFYSRKKGKIELINFSEDNNSQRNSKFPPALTVGENTNNNGLKINKENISFTSSRNPHIRNKTNKIEPLYNNNTTYAHNSKNESLILKNHTPKFVTSVKKLNMNQTYINNDNTQLNILDNKNRTFLSKTPEKYNNILDNLYNQNSQKSTIANEQSNSIYSVEPTRRYYYPRIGVNNSIFNNNIYNQYYSQKYNY